MSETYNGYTNYETWVVNLHLDNTQSLQEEWQAEARKAVLAAREALDPVRFDEERVRQEASYILASMLKESLAEERYPEVTGLYADLLNAALADVNWLEIARNYITNEEKV